MLKKIAARLIAAKKQNKAFIHTAWGAMGI
jgi:hypothetical protein